MSVTKLLFTRRSIVRLILEVTTEEVFAQQISTVVLLLAVLVHSIVCLATIINCKQVIPNSRLHVMIDCAGMSYMLLLETKAGSAPS